jgi:hypothetical protein
MSKVEKWIVVGKTQINPDAVKQMTRKEFVSAMKDKIGEDEATNIYDLVTKKAKKEGGK